MSAVYLFFFFSSRRRHTIFDCDWSSDLCSSDLHALSYVRPGQVIGLGSGQAAWAFVHELGRAVQAGLRVTAVPTSEATATRSEERRVGKECRSRWSPYH